MHCHDACGEVTLRLSRTQKRQVLGREGLWASTGAARRRRKDAENSETPGAGALEPSGERVEWDRQRPA